jgi:hypothetical protein
MPGISNQKYYIAPGASGKMYVLRVKGMKSYFSGNYPFDRLIKVLGTDLEEAKKKAEEHLGNTNFEVNSAPLKEITRKAKDPDKAWKWPFGQYKGQDVRYMDWDNDRVKSYSTWFWNANKTQRKEKDEEFFQKIQTILLEKGLILDYNGQLMTKKDYDYAKKKEVWAEEQKKVAEKSDFYGNKGDKIRKKIKLIFTRHVGETQWGTFNISKFVDEEDNTFTLKGPHPPFQDKEEFHDCVFTIKDYSEFRGEKQTIITRMKDLNPKPEEPETSQEEMNTKTEDQYSDRHDQDYPKEDYAFANESFYPRLNEYGYEDEALVFQQKMDQLEEDLAKKDSVQWDYFEQESGDLWKELGVENWREAFQKDAMACITFKEKLEAIVNNL